MKDAPWPDAGVDQGMGPNDEEDPRLCLVDVGSRGGLQEKWHAHAGGLRTVMFEPAADEAARLRAAHRPDVMIVDRALSDTDGPMPFYRTRNPLCASLLPPNQDVLSRYDIRGHFEVEETGTVNCARYDSLYRAGEVPLPDVIKVNVIGSHYEVLAGFGDLTRRCIGIETEAHIYPLCRGEKLLGAMVELLAGHGLVLRRLEPMGQFDGDLIVVNVFFTQPASVVRRFNPIRRGKFDMLTRVWDLPPYNL